VLVRPGQRLFVRGGICDRLRLQRLQAYRS
jgi:hypothetical protein